MIKLSNGILGCLMVLTSSAWASGRYHPNHLFVKMKKGQELVSSPLIKKSRKILSNLYLVKTENLPQLVSELRDHSDVEYVENDFYAGKKSMPKHEPLDLLQVSTTKMMDAILSSFNDPQVSKLWAFNGTTGMDVDGAYSALPARAAKEVIVAVVDTGVDHNHEDLKDVMWTNPREIQGNGKDDDNNGYVDDIHGINTLVRDANGHATMDTGPSYFHGTHVAGTIAATQNNGVGIAGVANNVKIMAIRTVPDDADELDSDVAEAYMYAAKNGAKIINCSFGKAVNEGGMAVRDVINEIGAKYGVLVIASAGNDSMGPFSWHDNDVHPKFPAAYDSANLLVIASTTSSGDFSGFSNIGPTTVDVAAPGSNVWSTMPGNKYGSASGTSMAAPNTSGVAAMVLGYFPNLKAVSLKQILMDSVTKVPAFQGKIVSGGRVNMRQALAKAAKKR